MTTTLTDLTPPRHDLDLYRGDTVRMLYQLGTVDDDGNFDEPYNLTGVTIAAQIRAKQDDTALLVDFDIELEDQTDLDTRGSFWIVLSATKARTLPATNAGKTWFWDLQVTWGVDDDQTIEWGLVTVDKDVTRAS